MKLILGIILVVIIAVGCGGNSGSNPGGSSLPTTPSSSTAPALSTLAGTWLGIQQGGGTNAWGLTWTATLTTDGSGLTGSVVFGALKPDVPGAQADARNANGTMTANLTGSGNGIAITMNFPARVGNSGPGGAFTPAGSPNCSMTANGTGNAAVTSIQASMQITWAGSCMFFGPPVIGTSTQVLQMVKQ